MPKKEIVGNLIEKLIVEDQRERFLQRKKIVVKRMFLIIFLSLMSNLLFVGMIFSYKYPNTIT